MAADALAAWIGALFVTVLSFAPSLLAPTSGMREFAAWLARIAIPGALLSALWTTAAWLEFVGPPSGLLLYALYLPLLVAIGLSGWGVGLLLVRLIEFWWGWRAPTFLSLLFAVAAIVWAIAAR